MTGTTPPAAGGVQPATGHRLSVHWHSESVQRVSDSESGLAGLPGTRSHGQAQGVPVARPAGGRRRPAAAGGPDQCQVFVVAVGPGRWACGCAPGRPGPAAGRGRIEFPCPTVRFTGSHGRLGSQQNINLNKNTAGPLQTRAHETTRIFDGLETKLET